MTRYVVTPCPCGKGSTVNNTPCPDARSAADPHSVAARVSHHADGNTGSAQPRSQRPDKALTGGRGLSPHELARR